MGAALFRGDSPARERMLRLTFPMARVLTRRDYGVDATSDAEPRAAILAAMDRVEAELGGGDYMVGDSFSVADLTAAALFTPIVRPPERPFLPSSGIPVAVEEFGDELTARPGGQWVLEMYRRHRGAYAGVPA